MAFRTRDERREDRALRRENRVWNDGTWFWEDEDIGDWGDPSSYSANTENGDSILKDFGDWLSAPQIDLPAFGNWIAEQLGYGVDDETRAMIEDLMAQYDDEYWQEQLGLIQSDAEGRFGLDELKSAGEYAQEIEDLKGEYQTVDEWMQAQGYAFGDTSEEQAAIDALAALLSDPDAAWGDQAEQFAAGLLGFEDNEAFAEAKEAMRQRLEGPNALANYEGMSESDRQLLERQNRLNVQEAERRAQRIVQNSMADTGSMARMMSEADEATRQISNMQIQQDVALAQEDFERQMANMQQEMSMYDRYLQSGRLGYTDYLQMRTQGANSALAAYSQKISAVMQQNQQYLGMHEADQRNIERQISAVTGLADIAAGLQADAQAWISNQWEMFVDAKRMELEAWAMAQDLNANSLAALMEAVSTVISIASSVVALV